MHRFAAVCLGVILVGAVAAPAQAQEVPPPHLQAISANPFGLLLEFFNAEYERVVSQSSTAGIGGSFNQFDDETYFNTDVFWRFYPQGSPLQRWAFGVKAGLTRGDLTDDGISESETYFGFGFDVNHSWLLGVNDNFYVGIGFGLKRLLGAGDTDLPVVPAIRLVNVGFAF